MGDPINPALTTEGGSTSYTSELTIRVPHDAFFITTRPWAGWDLKKNPEAFHASMTAGTVRTTRREMVWIINEMAQFLERFAPGKYDLTRAREAVHGYQNDCVFEIGRPKDRKLMGKVERVEDVPETGGDWITFSLWPMEVDR